MQEYAITVLGHDRPGIIAATAQALAGLGLNLTDSTMTRLRGHFAMTLICSATADPGLPAIESELFPIAADLGLMVTVRQVVAEQGEPGPGVPHILTVHGADRLGIVAALTSEVAKVGGNVTDLTTRLVGDLYLLIAEVDLPAAVPPESLGRRLNDVAADLGVEATLRPAEADLL